MTKTLRHLKVGDTATVSRIAGTGSLRQRLLDMGLTKGVRIQVLKVAPLGDPVEIVVRGYELTLRKTEGDCVQVV